MPELKNRLGDCNTNNQGLNMKIIRYKNNYDIDVEFDDGYISYNKQYSAFLKGQINNANHRKNSSFINRVGEELLLKDGSSCVIIRCKNSGEIDIKISQTGEVIKNIQYTNLIRNRVKPLYSKTVCGIGYVGSIGTIVDKRGRKFKSYETWRDMIRRCYDKKIQEEKHKSYKNCSVCEEWHNYSNFKEWFDINYYELKGESITLDKDILIKGNKVYSPETCIFVPKSINSMFNKRDSTGNSFVQHDKNYLKERIIVYKNKIPKYIYDILYNYDY